MRKITRIQIHYQYVLSKKGRNNQTRKWDKIKSPNCILSQINYDESFITLKEENLKKLLKKCKIEPSGIYHHDEEFLHENGITKVRLAIIDAVTNLIINNKIIYQEDFGQDFVEIFLKYSLEGFSKKILITDGHIMYPPIIERICIKQQLCISHIIKYHNDKSYKKMNKIHRRIKTLKTKIKQNEKN